MEAIHDRINSQRQRVNEIRNDVHNKMQLLQLEKRHLQRLLLYRTIQYMHIIIEEEQEKPKITMEDIDNMCPAEKICIDQVNDTCAVCLSTFKENETVRILSCNHIYHKDCIDRWLLNKEEPNCPKCRQAFIHVPQISEEEFQRVRELEHRNNLRLALYMLQTLVV